MARTLREEILDYSAKAHVATHFADAACTCGHRAFQLKLDDDSGLAVRRCAKCRREHPMGDSAEYLDEEDVELEDCQCPCGGEEFAITVGVALYRDSRAVKWLYVGCQCTACNVPAVYGDWKNEFEDYEELLGNI